MKKTFTLLLCLLLLCCTVFFVACSENENGSGGNDDDNGGTTINGGGGGGNSGGNEDTGSHVHSYGTDNVCVDCGNALAYTEGLKYTWIDNGTAYKLMDIGTATDTDIVIPYYYNNRPVTQIGDSAFRGENHLTSIAIPATVTYIGSSAFYGCSGLTEIFIPSSVTLIQSNAFGECSSLESITLPFVGANLKGYAYKNFGVIFGANSYLNNKKHVPASLKNVVVTGGNIIDDYAFYDCDSLVSISLPASVTSVGNHAFNGCDSLESITMEEGNAVYHAAGNCLIETATKSLIAGCKNSLIPTDGSVIDIALSAFRDCSGLTSINIPASVTSIGDSAFSDCKNLESVIFAEGSQLISVGFGGFNGCSSLTSIIISASVTSIGSFAFNNCSSLISVTVPISVTCISGYAFNNCSSLSLITIPENVTSIEVHAFYGCNNLTSVIYQGAISKWQTISKEYFWDRDTGDYIITCSDGTITKDGTVTMN